MLYTITNSTNSVIDYNGQIYTSGMSVGPIAIADPEISQLRASGLTVTAVVVPFAKPVFGQVKIAVTGTAVALPSNLITNGVTVQAKSSNTVTAAGVAGMVGAAGVTNVADGTGNGALLEPGKSVMVPANNTNSVYVNGTLGDVFSFFGN